MADSFEGEQEVYSHEILWRLADRLLEQAKSDEEGSYYDCLGALLTLLPCV